MKFPLIITLLSLLLLPTAFAQPHGNLHDAQNALHRAQSTLDAQDIHAAQHSLELAVEYANGQHRPQDFGISKRRDALDKVVQAAKAMDAHDRIKAAKLIEEALKVTNEAVSDSPKR